MISCFFPLGFALTDALAGCRLWMVILISGAISSLVELSQLYFKLGLFEFDDIFNNILGAVLGWCVFCILRSIGRKIYPLLTSQ